MTKHSIKSFSISLFAILISVNCYTNTSAQSLFENIEVIEVSELSGGDAAFINYTTTNTSGSVEIRRDWEEEIEEEIKYKIRMAQLDTEINRDFYPNRHLILNFDGQVIKFSTDMYYYSGHVRIGQWVKTLESDETVYTYPPDQLHLSGDG